MARSNRNGYQWGHSGWEEDFAVTVISENSNQFLRNLQETSLEIFTNCVCPVPSEQPRWYRSFARAEVVQEDLLQASISGVLCCDCKKHLQRAAFISFPPPQQTAVLYWRLTLVALYGTRRLVREPSIGLDSSTLHLLCQQAEILWVSSQGSKFPHLCARYNAILSNLCRSPPPFSQEHTIPSVRRSMFSEHIFSSDCIKERVFLSQQQRKMPTSTCVGLRGSHCPQQFASVQLCMSAGMKYALWSGSRASGVRSS